MHRPPECPLTHACTHLLTYTRTHLLAQPPTHLAASAAGTVFHPHPMHMRLGRNFRQSMVHFGRDMGGDSLSFSKNLGTHEAFCPAGRDEFRCDILETPSMYEGARSPSKNLATSECRAFVKWPWVITYGDPILGRMNAHVPPILMFTRGTGFGPTAKWGRNKFWWFSHHESCENGKHGTNLESGVAA